MIVYVSAAPSILILLPPLQKYVAALGIQAGTGN